MSGYDRPGLLNEVMQVVNEAKTNISAVSGRADRDKLATINLTIRIRDIAHLYKVVDRIKQIPDIYSVQRVTN